jgi:hypothetical protein
MNESADLIRRALEETKDTYPKKTDEPKVIPGTPKTEPLRRTASTEIEGGRLLRSPTLGATTSLAAKGEIMSNELISYYKEFLGENWLIDEGTTCLTWFNSCDVEAAASVFGADLGSATPMSYSDAYGEAFEEIERSSQGNAVLFGVAGSWNIAMEPYGWRGMDDQVIRGLARYGAAISVLLAAGSHHRVTYAHDGHRPYVVRWLDEREGPVPRALDEHLNGLSIFGDVDSDEWKASALALAQRFTGVRLDQEWLERQHVRYLIR